MVGVMVTIVFAGLALAPMVCVVWLLVYAARASTVTVGRCRRCGYDLRQLGASRACPECGEAFVVNERGDAVSGAPSTLRAGDPTKS